MLIKNYGVRIRQIFKGAISLLFIFSYASCKKNANSVAELYDVVYLESNNFNADQNSILAYQVKSDGSLTPLAGSPFLTKGAGVANPQQILGPADSDFEIKLSSDGKYLMAVNSGSNTIAVFAVKYDGTLEQVPGSPFPSGGETPVSIDVAGDRVFVINKSQNPYHTPTLAPNYSTFAINSAGFLTSVPGGKFETTPGSSPAQAYVSRDHRFLFGVDFLGSLLTPPVGTLRSFTISGTGLLTPAPGTPYVLPSVMPKDNGALGVWQSPIANILYVGFPLQGKVGVYNIDPASGALSYLNAVPAGKAACWFRTNRAGTRLYDLNSGDNTVQVYNTTNPAAPASLQTIELKNSGPEYPGPGGAMFKTSEPFSLAFSTLQDYLYVVNQHTNKDFSIGNYNYLHTLKVAVDGTLSEQFDPIQLPVPNAYRPKGSLVLARTNINPQITNP